MNTLVFEHAFPAAAIGIAVALVALATILSHVWRVKHTAATWVILALRMAWIALLAWCLLLPQQQTHTQESIRPRFVILLDTSASMTVTARPETPDRWTQAMDLLALPWRDTIRQQATMTLHGFDEGITESHAPEQARAMTPSGMTTRLRRALDAIGDRYTGQDLAGVLLLSDGLDTQEDGDGWARNPRPFPVFTVALEPEDPDAWVQTAEVRVERVETARRVTAGWTSELQAVISGTGTEGRPIRIQLFRDDHLLREHSLQIPAEGGSRTARFELEHPDPGTYHYRVHAVPLPDEENTDDNDFEIAVLAVTRDNHLLYLEGPPRWESRFLTRALRANPDVVPLVFLSAPGGAFLTIGNRGSMTPELRPDQLAFFKIVILGNLDAHALGATRTANLVAYVEDGGSLILLGGSAGWSASGFTETPLSAVIPVRFVDPRWIEGDFPTALTDAGHAHPAFAGSADLWDALPPVLSIRTGAIPGPAASTLVEAETPDGRQPLMVVHRYGQGKVAVILTDSLWHWQMRSGEQDPQRYRRFWDQFIGGMMPEETQAEGPRIALFSDREHLSLGQAIELSAHRVHADSDATRALACEITTPDGRTLPFAMRPRSGGPAPDASPGFTVDFRPEVPGLYSAVAVDPANGLRHTSDPVSFYVQPFSPEARPRPSNTGVLRTLAEVDGGRFFRSAADADDGLSTLRFEQREVGGMDVRTRWQRGWILAVLLLLLCAEWTLRKRRNMP